MLKLFAAYKLLATGNTASVSLLAFLRERKLTLCNFQPLARTASQKLATLFEPDEPGRREFIEAILQYWEEKDLPLKNAPLMGRKTVDLFRLYHLVKERGGMLEVIIRC